MRTVWLPHLITNSLSLLLPDAIRLLHAMPNTSQPPASPLLEDVRIMEKTVDSMVRDNPDYAAYVTPLALGYILSHPRFNIYKGGLAEKRFMGLGLDALPHGATAFGLAALVADTADEAVHIVPRQNALYPLVRWAADYPTLFSGLVLALATLFWEVSEYRVHQIELAQRGGDITKINMQWSMEDTLRDCAANTLGWLTAMLFRSLRGRR